MTLSLFPPCPYRNPSHPPRCMNIQKPRHAWRSPKEAKRRVWSWTRGDSPGPTQNGSEHTKADFSQEENIPVSKVPRAPCSQDKNAAPTRTVRCPGAFRVSLENRAAGDRVKPLIPHTKLSFKQQRPCHWGVPTSILHSLSSLVQTAPVRGQPATAFAETEQNSGQRSPTWNRRPLRDRDQVTEAE